MGQRTDRVKSCLGCRRLFGVVVYERDMLCTECWAEQRTLARAVERLRDRPAHTTECAFGCLLHNLGAEAVAEAVGVEREEVMAWIRSLLVPEAYHRAVWREWGVRWAHVEPSDGPRAYRVLARRAR